MSRELIGRIRGEFLEMPGLKLSLQQACRLWNLSATACGAALDELRAEGFLYQTQSGAFIAFPSATRMLKAETPSERLRCPHCFHLNSVNVSTTDGPISFRCVACRKLVAGVVASA
jgi:hypothetical protein